MALPKAPPTAPVTTAMVCAGAVSAQFIAGKATRDALFLAHLDVTALPSIVIATAGLSIVLVALSSRGLRRIAPAALVPAAFVLSAVLLLATWGLAQVAPQLAAQAFYLQISGLGPMLGSGFWLIASELFDPYTARHKFGRIAAAGTLSGLVGALLAERVAAMFGIVMMLPVLAVLNLLCAWLVAALASSAPPAARPVSSQSHILHASTTIIDGPTQLEATAPSTGLRVLAATPYLRTLAAFVLLSTIGATLADYVFKLQAVEALGRGETLLRFFAIYYAATTLLAFLVQTFFGGAALDRLGLALTTSTAPLALCVGGALALAFPGVWTVLLMRSGESIFRGSLFRPGYETFYTPVPADEKRAAKSIIDVGFDRLGDAVGAGLVRLLIVLPAALQFETMLGVAVASAGLALVFARQLNRGYIETLERSLLDRAVELDLSDTEDSTTRTAILNTRRLTRTVPTAYDTQSDQATASSNDDAEIQNILALRSRSRTQVLRILRADEPLSAPLVPHVIPLLGWDAVADDAVRALRGVAEERLGLLTDTLLDPGQPFAVRRRLARVFSVCFSQRAADSLLLALDDARFEVRFQCGRSLASIAGKNALIKFDRERIFEIVRREVAVGRPVWQSHRLLDQLPEERASFVDEFIKDRAGQSLAHVFILLSLVLPSTPLQIAYRGLHTSEPGLRGTALEYLEGVLPPDIRDRLWPFLDTTAATSRESTRRGREEILADLLRSNDSIVMNLEELRRRSGAGHS